MCFFLSRVRLLFPSLIFILFAPIHLTPFWIIITFPRTQHSVIYFHVPRSIIAKKQYFWRRISIPDIACLQGRYCPKYDNFAPPPFSKIIIFFAYLPITQIFFFGGGEKIYTSACLTCYNFRNVRSTRSVCRRPPAVSG